MKNFISRLSSYMDRSLSHGHFSQLLWFAFLAFIVLALLYAAASVPNDTIYPGMEGDAKNLRGVIFHFLDPEGLLNSHNQPWYVQIIAALCCLSGMVLLGGLLISTICNMIERRVSEVQHGRISYTHLKNHYIIIGYGDLTHAIIDDIFKQNSEKLPYIIIFSNQDILRVREKVAAHFSCEHERKILFYSGDIESNEHLKKLNISTARSVYVLGDEAELGRDSKNLASLLCLSSERGNSASSPPLPVYVQFDRIASYSIIQKLTLPSEYTCQPTQGQAQAGKLKFRPFNFYENWARLLWGFTPGVGGEYDKLDYEPVEGEKFVHLFIIGFNRMGRALLFEALRLCHYPNFDEHSVTPIKTKITIIDRRAHELQADFEAEYPYLRQIMDVDIHYLQGCISCAEPRERITAASKNPHALTTIAICFGDPDLSISTALSLPYDVYYGIEDNKPKGSETRVLIRQELQKGLSHLLEKAKFRYENLRVFGMLNQGADAALLDDTLPMYVNAYYDVQWASGEKEHIKGKYRAYTQELIEQDASYAGRDFLDWLLDDPHHAFMKIIAEEFWQLTSEDHRFSNRYQVDNYDNYQRYESAPELAQMEHLRWCAERSIIGYRDTSSYNLKDNDYQLHKLIIPYHDLPEGEKKKDREVLRNRKRLLAVHKKYKAPSESSTS